MEDILSLLIPFAAFAMVIGIVWIASREKLAKARIRAELQKELLTKFSSSGELMEFLGSEGSKLFLQDPPRNAANRVIKREQDRLDRLRWRILLFEIFSFLSIGACTLLAFNSMTLDVGFEEMAAAVQRLVPPLNDLFLVTFASLAVAVALLGLSLWVHPLLSDD